MSDTVQIALITFSAGLFSSVISAFVALHTAKSSRLESRWRTLRDEKAAAYSAFLGAYFAWSDHVRNVKFGGTPDPTGSDESRLFSVLETAYARATLFSIPDVVGLLRELMDCALHYGQTRQLSENAGETLNRLLSAMQSDLNSLSD